MLELWNFLKGKKTYLLSVAMIIWAIWGWNQGQLNQEQFQQTIMNALGMAFIRHGIQTATQ